MYIYIYIYIYYLVLPCRNSLSSRLMLVAGNSGATVVETWSPPGVGHCWFQQLPISNSLHLLVGPALFLTTGQGGL